MIARLRGPVRSAALAAALAAAFGLPGRAGAAPDDAPPPARPDLLFYVRHVARFLEDRCASCHASGAGGFRLTARAPGLPEEKRLREEFREVSRLVDPGAPWGSRLLLKVLDPDEGGVPHAGGVFLRTDAEEYDTLLDFASGATLSNLPPEPEPGKDRRARPGEEVTLDGSLSYDRDGDAVRHRWDLFVRPPGSKATLAGDREAVARITPDVPGTYVVRLRVFDGKAWSAPRPVVLEALDRVGPVAPDPVAGSGLEVLDGAELRIVRSIHGDVLGRPPTPPEALAQRGRTRAEVAGTLLATLEAGRAWVEDAAFRLGLVAEDAPLSEAVQTLPFRIAGGQASPGEAEALLARDPAFLRAHPAGPRLADAVLGLLLGRDPGGPERATILSACAGTPVAWLGRTGLVGAAAVVDATVASPAFHEAAMRRQVVRLLPGPAADAVPAARSGEPIAALTLSVVSSPAYAGASATRRPASDLAFARAVFADLLGRRPTASESWALASATAILPGTGVGRAAIVDVLLDSGEVPLPLIADLADPAAWIADRFLRTLGRAPSEEEAKAYRAALMDPDGGPHVVVRALLTTPEYAAR